MHDAVQRESLHRAGYIADEALATTLWLAGELQRPLLTEVDAGVGHRPWPALAGWADSQSERVKTGFHNLCSTPPGVHRWAEAEPVNPLLVRVFGTLRATQRHACGEAEAPFFASADDLLQRIQLPERLTFVRFLVTGLRDTVSAANRSAHVDLGNAYLPPSHADVPPLPGPLIVFPSWLGHQALPYDGERDRVVVSSCRSTPACMPRRAATSYTATAQPERAACADFGRRA